MNYEKRESAAHKVDDCLKWITQRSHQVGLNVECCHSRGNAKHKNPNDATLCVNVFSCSKCVHAYRSVYVHLYMYDVKSEYESDADTAASAAVAAVVCCCNEYATKVAQLCTKF